MFSLRALFAIGVALASCLFGLSAQAQSQGGGAYCSPTGALVIFAVDITTPYDQTDKSVIVGMTDKILGNLRGGDRLVVRTIGDSHTHSERLIERCVPYCAANGSLDRLFNCSDGAIRTDAERMRLEVVGALRNRLSKFEELKHSDIVRTIHSIASEEARDGRPLKLFIYSDLVENSDYFSPRYLFSYSTQRLIDGLKIYKLIAPLRDAEIVVAGLGRWDGSDRRALTVAELNKLKEFWGAYFKESGANSVTMSLNPP